MSYNNYQKKKGPQRSLAKSVTGATVEVWEGMAGADGRAHVSAKAKTYEAWASSGRYIPPFEILSMTPSQIQDNLYMMTVEIVLRFPNGQSRKSRGMSTFTMGPVMEKKERWKWNEATRKKDPYIVDVDTNQNFIEKAQTKAISKALSNVGYGYVLGMNEELEYGPDADDFHDTHVDEHQGVQDDAEDQPSPTPPPVPGAGAAALQELQQGVDYSRRAINGIRHLAFDRGLDKDPVMKAEVQKQLGDAYWPLDDTVTLEQINQIDKDRLSALMVFLKNLKHELKQPS